MPLRLSRTRFRSVMSRWRANARTRAHHAVLVVKPAAFSGRTGSPADFAAWAERGISRTGGVPDAWRGRNDIPIPAPARVAVVLHVHYPELADEILDALRSIPVPFDLIVTRSTKVPFTIDRERVPGASSIVVLEVDNRGRDILPLISVVNAGLLDPYHLILKVHTKRSVWREDHTELPGTGAAWRDRLLGDLLGDATNVRTILDAFATRPELGLVTGDGSLLHAEFWGDNQAVTANLLRRLELDLRPDDLAFAAGSMYWIRGFVLQGLRALNLTALDFEAEAGQVNATTAHAVERIVGIVTREAGLTASERTEIPGATAAVDWTRFDPDRALRPRARMVPFYLPQFHPIEQNDRWWGRGFTEWSNVAAARPVYLGHHQPKLPADTGFYDLRLEQTLRLQATMARDAGITGFMYYHYWFAGQELLEGPIRSRLTGDVDLPFCLMWANENWTRRWDGRESDVLIGQHYEEVPAAAFIEDVLPILRDPRYMRIDGRPLIAIYRPTQIPDTAQTIAAWRAAARREGIGELFVMSVDVVKDFDGVDHMTLGDWGLDGTLGFPPHNALWDWLPHQHVGAVPGFGGSILSYQALVRDAIETLERGTPDRYYPGVMVNFDNTARRQASPDIWFGSNPYTFRRWLAAAVASVAHRDPEHRLVFINAWNEWAEGAVLEPSDRFGSTFLQAVRDVAYG